VTRNPVPQTLHAGYRVGAKDIGGNDGACDRLGRCETVGKGVVGDCEGRDDGAMEGREDSDGAREGVAEGAADSVGTPVGVADTVGDVGSKDG